MSARLKVAVQPSGCGMPMRFMMSTVAMISLLRRELNGRSTRAKVYGFDTGFVCAHRGWTSIPEPSTATVGSDSV